ncbi:hypothetical protein AMS64_04980 [Aeromonas veronii]|uniref:hypothetical protein n=1 Tax=Aeromonas veronii TaxID=654 RepID=UPI00078E32CE|nr:hypothetical protein [Aeromonas veronii]AMQ41785.1 hypothetical protein AMS64_04980 [Aeromonas veronii]MCX0429219.1 hypothetical protein [Aeromonas veronii]MCX0450252.1 hypothetical protein [Aeromonas veronii]POG19632.1 hypothetical protein C2849_08910 [Aeromonas veronii]
MNLEKFLNSVTQQFLQDEKDSREDRLGRLRELNTLFGPQGDQLLEGGYQSLLALHEVANSYVSGNFMAVVLLSQAFIEHSLSGRFVMMGQDELAQSSFKKIIDAAKDQSIVTPDLHKKLDSLRRIRNPYVHAKVGLKDGSLQKKMMDKQVYDPVEMARLDAFEALKVLKEFKDNNIYMWFSQNEI